MSPPTYGEGYAGALYTFVSLRLRIKNKMASKRVQRMTEPRTAPTIAATGTELPRLGIDGAAVNVPVTCSVTVRYGGSARLTVNLDSYDGLAVTDEAVPVIGVIEEDGVGFVIEETVVLDGLAIVLEISFEAMPCQLKLPNQQHIHLHRPGVRS